MREGKVTDIGTVLGGVMADMPTPREDKAPTSLDQCAPPAGVVCEGGWHFRDTEDFYGREAVGRCDARRRQEIRAKVSSERERLEGALGLLAGYGGARFEGYDTTRHVNAGAALSAMEAFSR